MDVVGWLESQGGKVAPEIAVEYAPDKGNYITGAPKPGQLLIQVPAPVLVNVKTLGVTERSHDNLARYLYETKNTWTESIPEIELPLAWSSKDIDRLPPKHRRRVLEQQAEVQQAFCEDTMDYNRWVWAWSSVNSRCLYWDVGLERPDQMTLAPLIDFFNHSTDPTNCISIKNKLGKMCAFAPQNPTRELNLFYGPHENGFLLVEYGFVATDNQWDHIDITDEVIDLGINTSLLQSMDYMGNYTLSSEGPCFRTMVALSSITGSPKQVERYSQGLDEIPDLGEYLIPLYQRLDQRYTIQSSDRPEIKALYAGYHKILKLHQCKKEKQQNK